jgi:hypothetical protein
VAHLLLNTLKKQTLLESRTAEPQPEMWYGKIIDFVILRQHLNTVMSSELHSQ